MKLAGREVIPGRPHAESIWAAHGRPAPKRHRLLLPSGNALKHIYVLTKYISAQFRQPASLLYPKYGTVGARRTGDEAERCASTVGGGLRQVVRRGVGGGYVQHGEECPRGGGSVQQLAVKGEQSAGLSTVGCGCRSTGRWRASSPWGGSALLWCQWTGRRGQTQQHSLPALRPWWALS